jgi:ppGpp synthetase/RelA/SpoT-type nucleotidyltranferase
MKRMKKIKVIAQKQKGERKKYNLEYQKAFIERKKSDGYSQVSFWIENDINETMNERAYSAGITKKDFIKGAIEEYLKG